tara:strand:- start:9176 stop:9931 length:756 start_codon:yes stop_codon:yes gene_type:complete
VASLSEITQYCDQRLKTHSISDFPGAANGLQLQNGGAVTKIGAAVDAGFIPFEKAVQNKVDFLIVHHGLFWEPAYPITEIRYKKYKLCLENNLAIYGAHLPLDCHPEIGNNVLLAKQLNLQQKSWFLEYEGTPIGLITNNSESRASLKAKLEKLFPAGITAIEKGSSEPNKVAIVTGSGASAISEITAEEVDTLITGELKQHVYNQAEELALNLYCCGHYATEVFGVKALAKEVAKKFQVEWEFIETECPL